MKPIRNRLHPLLFSLISILPISANDFTDAKSDTTRTVRTTIRHLSTTMGVDLLSRMLWRGYQVGRNPGIGPFFFLHYGPLSLELNGLMIGANDYAEANINLYYRIGGLHAVLYHYIVFDADAPQGYVTRFSRSNTPYTGDLQLTYTFPRYPFSLQASTLLWGNDYRPGTTANRYSTYLRAAYTFSIRKCTAEPYISGTPAAGLYAPSGRLTNAGIVFGTRFVLSPTFSIPLHIEFSYNTVWDKLFFAATLRLETNN